MSKSDRVNQLSNPQNYDVNKMIFSAPQLGSVPNTPIVFKRISISTLNNDKTIGDLIFPTEELFSFGVSENKNPETKKVNGHVLPLCLWRKEGPTNEEKRWTDTFNSVVEHCKKHLIENKEAIEQYDLSESDLKKLNPLYWKKEKGKIVEGQGPTLYAKLIASKKHNKILSMFFNHNGDVIEPMSVLGKYCYVRAAVKIESVFVGNKISLQVKLYEAEIRLMDGGMKPLMSRPKTSGLLLNNNSNPPVADSEDGDDGSLNNSENEDDFPAPVPAPTVQPVKKVVKRVAAKKP
jgi:hypothetical protein